VRCPFLARTIHQCLLRRPILSLGEPVLVRPPRRTAGTPAAAFRARSLGGLPSRTPRDGIHEQPGLAGLARDLSGRGEGVTIHRREEGTGERMVGDAMVHCLPFLDFTVVRVKNLPDLSFSRATSIRVRRSAQYGTCSQQAILVSAGSGDGGLAGCRVEVDRRE